MEILDYIKILDLIEKNLSYVVNIIWSPLTIVGFLTVALYFSVQLKFLQIFKLLLSCRLIFRRSKKSEKGDVTGAEALMSAMASIIGTGNVAGVAFAISAGGPGALFWMWVSAFFGMIVKYMECYLGSHYRIRQANGEMIGGPMYYIQNGFEQQYGWNMKWYACLYAAFSICLPILNSLVHANTITANVQSLVEISTLSAALLLFVAVFLVVIGGISTIAYISTKLVPFMSILYVFGGIVVLFMTHKNLLSSIHSIFIGAFSPTSVAGGVAGFTLKNTIQMGLRRGLFSSESGRGAAAVFSATAKTDHPATQAFIGMTGTFFDTIICTMTGLVVLSTGVWSNSNHSDAIMVKEAFDMAVFPGFGMIVSIGLIFFAYTSMFALCYFGDRGVNYLLGPSFLIPYRIIFSCTALVGPMITLRKLVWTAADIFSGLLIIINMVALMFLAGKLIYPETGKYLQEVKKS